jgi:hypothetical protein
MKITTSEIQKNDYSAMYFYDAMNHSVKAIRANIAFYEKTRKVNTSIFGYVKALSLLCEHATAFDIPIILKEAQQWEEILIKYCNRIQKKISENIREEFITNLTKNLETIVSKGKDEPEHFWKDKLLEREIRITIKNQELLNKYESLIDEKKEYKDRLGNSLHNYIKDCLNDLYEEKSDDLTEKITVTKPISFQPTYFKSNVNEFTYLLSDFSFFLNNENVSELNAYDIEKKIKTHLKKVDKKLLKQLKFDCESSLFCVQSESLENLNNLNNHLLKIAVLT